MHKANKLFTQLGYDQETAQIYTFLLTNGSSTVLEISKGIGVNRMNIYRKCEQLVNDGLLKELAAYKTTRYEVTTPQTLTDKIQGIESNLQQAKKGLQQIEEIYEQQTSLANQKIKVVHYSGREQVKQLLWNVTKSKTELLSFGYRTLSEVTGVKFIQRWWYTVVKKKLVNRIIMNPDAAASKDEVEKPEVKALYLNDTGQKIWQPRYIEKDVLHITQETFVYNDIYSLIQWDQETIFGVEIYNKTVADMEKQIFERFWELADIP